jgi:plastocyanin
MKRKEQKYKNENGNILLLILVLGAVAFGVVTLYPKFMATKVAEPEKEVMLGANFDTPAVEIKITAGGYEPAVVTIKKGARVTWVNTDKVPHSLSSVENFGSNRIDIEMDELLEAEDSLEVPFEQMGTFKYEDKDDTGKYQGVIVVE